MKKIGIIGGGQLGKMMILDAKRLNYYIVILDPEKNCPAHSIADEHIIADFNDKEAIFLLSEKTDIVTYEFEHISLRALEELEAAGCKVVPSSFTLSHIQNKLEQKKWLKQFSIPVPEFREIGSYKELEKACEFFGYPMILKTCTGGYDGKGNAVIKNPEGMKGAYEAMGGGKLPLMAEEWIDFEKEISVLACKSTCGQTAIFPIAENIHKNSILDETIVPAGITEAMEQEAFRIGNACVEAVQSFGMLCIEMFAARDGRILVNELAPRPHNSGHYTIEGCCTSQYEQHMRAILGLPLGNTGLLRPAAMKNLIGERKGSTRVQGIEEAYGNQNVKVHIYGKTSVSPGRKMGHITALGTTREEALLQVRKAHEHIRF